MRLSTKTLYGTRLMFELALNYNKGVMRLGDMARNQGLSEKYSEQIISLLKGAELVNAQRGAEGGYVLSRPAYNINMKDIVETLEGSLTMVDKEEAIGQNDSSQFINFRVWELLSNKIGETLTAITLEDLVNEFINRSSELNYEI